MLQVEYHKCGEKLTEPGGILLSPPTGGWVRKYHICVGCWIEPT